MDKKAASEHKKRIAFEKRWARYKYNIMERNYRYYKNVSRRISNGETPQVLNEVLGEYLVEPITEKAVVNTFQHVWGYFKKRATNEEKQCFKDLLEAYEKKKDRQVVKTFLLSLTLKYQVPYLQASHYFDELFLKDKDLFGDMIVHWFSQHQRLLKFRESKEPYKVWLSEIMCQQTQVATMLAYYEKFIEQWPTVTDLANASEDEVLKAWEGLGYYGRARRLLQCACKVVNEYDGVFPTAYKHLIKCPGIGSYTAGAILSICHNQQVPAVDGNVMRVVSRVFNSHLDIAEPATKKVIEEQVRDLIPEEASYFNQGIMELGAMICTPTNPKCDQCPVKNICIGRGLEVTGILPIKSKAKKKRIEKLLAVLIKTEDKYLFVKTGSEGLLAGLWALPAVAGESVDIAMLEAYLYDEMGLEIRIPQKVVASHKHVFTHKVWEMELYEVIVGDRLNIDYPVITYATWDEIDELAISTAFRRLLNMEKEKE